MNFGGMAPGLSAVPGGMMAGTGQMQQLDLQQLQLQDQKAKQIGMQAYFRALQSMGMPPSGQQGPQPPMPGQPSTPAMPGPQMMPPQGTPQGAPQPQQQPNVMGPQGPMQPNPQGVYPPNAVMMPPGGPQGAPQGPPQGMPQGMPQQPPGGPQGAQQPLTWQQVAQAIKQQNPGVDDLALAHAVDKFMPLMTMQSQADWRQQRMELQYELTRMRDDTSRRNADVRADTAADVEGGRQARAAATDTRLRERADEQAEQFRAREDRLERGLKLRGDSTWARLDQQKQAAQARIAQGDKRQAVTEYRAALDAQHKRAMEIIQSTSQMNNMKAPDREKFIKEQNEWYNGEITKLRNLATQQGNISGETPVSTTVTDAPVRPRAAPSAAPAAPAAPEQQPQGGLPPEAAKALQEGIVTTFQNGQKWTLENGQPKQVQ